MVGKTLFTLVMVEVQWQLYFFEWRLQPWLGYKILVMSDRIEVGLAVSDRRKVKK